MSNHWELVCADCDDAMPGEVNHGDVVLSELAAVAPWFAEHAKTLNLFAIDAAHFHGALGAHFIPVHVAWLSIHGTHRLIVRDEYGNRATECNHQQRAIDRKLGDSSFCTLDKDHDGNHDYTPRNSFTPKDVP